MIYCDSLWLDVILIMDTKYTIIDTKTGNIIAIRNTQRAAHKLADKKDREYGMYRYQVKKEQ